MNYKKMMLIFTFYVGFASSITSCYVPNQQMRDAFNKWFNKTTFITGGALVSSALLGVVFYKAVTRWVFNYLNSEDQQTNGNVTEIPYDVVHKLKHELTTNNWNPKTIQKLRKNETYKNYLDFELTDHYYQEIQNALKKVPVQDREQWIDTAQHILKNTEQDKTNDGWELGRSGTKMKALQKVNNPFVIPYHSSQSYKSPKELLLPQ